MITFHNPLRTSSSIALLYFLYHLLRLLKTLKSRSILALLSKLLFNNIAKSSTALSLYYLALLPTVSFAQPQFPIPQAQVIVDSLSSSYFNGRGYGVNQDSLVAAYIASLYKSAGLSPLMSTYFQEFGLEVPIHDETPVLSINDTSLKPGIDFLPYDSSPSVSLLNLTYFVEAGSGLYLPDQGVNDYLGKNPQGAVVILNDEIPDSLRANPDIPAQYLPRAIRTEIAAYLGAKAVLFKRRSSMSYGGGSQRVRIPAFIVHESSWPENLHTLDLKITSRLQVPVTTSNVIGYRQGSQFPKRYIVLMGHYDHLGQLGPDHFFPGANDNASGIALLVNIASYFQHTPLPYSLLFIAFSGEEQGLLGSKYFVENPPVPLDSIRFVLNLDMVASGSGGLVALGGNEFPEEYELLKTLNDSLQLGSLRKRSNAPNSDHYFFLKNGVPGFFLYTDKGTQPYHHIQDIPETLNWKEYEDTFELVRHFIQALDSHP